MPCLSPRPRKFAVSYFRVCWKGSYPGGAYRVAGFLSDQSHFASLCFPSPSAGRPPRDRVDLIFTTIPLLRRLLNVTGSCFRSVRHVCSTRPRPHDRNDIGPFCERKLKLFVEQIVRFPYNCLRNKVNWSTVKNLRVYLAKIDSHGAAPNQKGRVGFHGQEPGDTVTENGRRTGAGDTVTENGRKPSRKLGIGCGSKSSWLFAMQCPYVSVCSRGSPGRQSHLRPTSSLFDYLKPSLFLFACLLLLQGHGLGLYEGRWPCRECSLYGCRSETHREESPVGPQH